MRSRSLRAKTPASLTPGSRSNGSGTRGSARRPLILITGSLEEKGQEFADLSVDLSNRYLAAIVAGGGLPMVMPYLPDRALLAEYVRRADGIVLSGGDDIQPALYQAELTPELRKTLTVAHPRRDLVELMLIDEVFRQRKPLLAICRGHQLLQVALGGRLIVDIPSQRYHALRHSRTDLKDQPVHEARIAPGSLMRRLFRQERIQVNSTHHQGVVDPAPPLQSSALAPDGLVEAMELEPASRELLPFLLSVQFHPERLYDRYPAFRRVFGSFVTAAASFKARPS